MSPIVDQGSLGSCTANAIASGLREYLLKSSQESWTELSRLFLYWHERQLEGHIDEDSGAFILDGMKVLQKIGVCPEVNYPYFLSDFQDRSVREAELTPPTTESMTTIVLRTYMRLRQRLPKACLL